LPIHISVARTDPRISFGKKAFVPLGATDTWRWSVCVVVAVVAASAALVRQHITADSTSEEPEFSDSYPGITRPRDVSTLALPTPVTVKKVLVEIGDRVRVDQPLLMLDDEDANRVVGQLRFEVERSTSRVAQLERTVDLLDRSINALLLPAAEASKRLALAQRTADSVPNRQAKDSPERAQAGLDQALAHRRRVRALADDGIVARQELEDAEIAVRVATDDLFVARRAADASAALAFAQALQAETQANLTIAEQQRHRQERFGELTQARMHQVEAQSTLGLAIQRLGDLTVRATGDALVAEICVKPGDRLLAGVPLVKLATVNPMIVDVDVPPAIVNALVRGEAAAVRINGSSIEYPGRIRTIAPLPGDAGSHTLEVEFENPTSALLVRRIARVRLSAHQ
jgi:multidrug resistance efflux pump